MEEIEKSVPPELPEEVGRWLEEQAKVHGRSTTEVTTAILMDAYRRFQRLQADLQEGIDAIENGDYTEYQTGDAQKLVDEIKAEGRARLAQGRRRA